jgi:hypothetical protein
MAMTKRQRAFKEAVAQSQALIHRRAKLKADKSNLGRPGGLKRALLKQRVGSKGRPLLIKIVIWP